MGLSRFSFSTEPLSVPALQASLADSRCGGYAAFEGWVRNHNEGREVTGLEYEAFAELAVRAGLPAGLINVVLGDGQVTGNAITGHPDIAKVSFTGSTRAGSAASAGPRARAPGWTGWPAPG